MPEGRSQVDAGKMKPLVETVLPLSEARRAHELNETGHSRGKTVLKVAYVLTKWSWAAAHPRRDESDFLGKWSWAAAHPRRDESGFLGKWSWASAHPRRDESDFLGKWSWASAHPRRDESDFLGKPAR